MSLRSNFIKGTFFVGLFIVLIVQSSCRTFKNNPENTDRVRKEILSLIENSNGQLHFDIDSLPLSIFHYMESDANRRIIVANPNDRMRVSDGIDESNYDLPVRRLLFWNKIDSDYIVAYEKGGRAHNIIVLHFKQNIRLRLVSSFSVFAKPKNSVKYILEVIRNNKVLLLYDRNTKIDARYFYY